MTATTLLLALLLPAIVLIGVVNWVLETTEDRARRWRRAGLSQAQIASRLGISRYKVRRLLA